RLVRDMVTLRPGKRRKTGEAAHHHLAPAAPKPSNPGEAPPARGSAPGRRWPAGGDQTLTKYRLDPIERAEEHTGDRQIEHEVRPGDRLGRLAGKVDHGRRER